MLEISGVHYRYPGTSQAALTNVSLSVQRGQILGLLGHNGAGKSTLVAHIAGLLAVQQGMISIDGQSLSESRHVDPTRVAVAPQEYAFYPTLTVSENLACFAAVNQLGRNARHAAVERAFATTQLGDYGSVRAEKLSGGLKRRLNLAIALLASPDLLVLDEPTVGVDTQSRALLLETVKQLAEEDVAVIYTSHYLEEVESIADQVAILDHGVLIRYGALNELLAEGAARLSVLLSTDPPETLVSQLQGFGTVQLVGRQIHVQLSPMVSAVEVLRRIEAICASQILKIHAGSYTLEQLFTQLTRNKHEAPKC